MVGISLYSGYIPRYRLNRMTVFSAVGWLNPANIANASGEKAVANYDEDPITMAVSAGNRCLGDTPLDSIDALYFASTTAPFKERLNAGIIAGALCLKDDIRTADFGGSLRAGTSALLSALEFCGFNKGAKSVVCTADCRLGRAGSVQEMFFGDAAASLLISTENVIAEYLGSYSITADFVDHIRGSYSRYDRQWEERWIRDLGFEQFIPKAMEGFCNKYSMKPQDFQKVIYPCYYKAARKGINKKLGLSQEQVQDDLQGSVGDSGSAHSILMLAKTLESSAPGDKILVMGYGNGCDAILFEVTENINKLKVRDVVSREMKSGVELDKYEKYLIWRNMTPADVGMRGEEDRITRWSLVWRNNRALLSLQGVKCLTCGTQQYPPQRICVNPDCGQVDNFENIYLSGKGGRIFSFTSDMLSATVNPPAMYGNVEFEGGGRMLMDFTDCSLDDLTVGGKVKFSFRVKYYDEKRDITFYFWKAVPEGKEVS